MRRTARAGEKWQTSRAWQESFPQADVIVNHQIKHGWIVECYHVYNIQSWCLTVMQSAKTSNNTNKSIHFNHEHPHFTLKQLMSALIAKSTIISCLVRDDVGLPRACFRKRCSANGPNPLKAHGESIGVHGSLASPVRCIILYTVYLCELIS